MATSPEAFYDLIKKVNKYDGVIGGRYLKGRLSNQDKHLLGFLFLESLMFLFARFF